MCDVLSPPILTRTCLRVLTVVIRPLSASERQSGVVLGGGPEGKVGVELFQYSSGSRTVVTLRSASVTIQILAPLLSV